MMRNNCFVTLIALLGAFILDVYSARAEEMVLVDQEGREILVDVITVTDGLVQFRRPGIDRPYILNLSELSEKTQAALRTRGGKNDPAFGAVGLEWGRLLVTFPEPGSSVSATGLGGGIYHKGAHSHEVHLPVGAWIKVNLRSPHGSLEHLIQFDGMTDDWVFTVDGSRVLLSRDGGPREIVGVTLLEGKTAAELYSEEIAPLAEKLSIEFQAIDQMDLANAAPRKIASVLATNYPVSDRDVIGIARIAPVALSLDIDYQHMDILVMLDGVPIESLSLEFLKEPNERDGNKRAQYPVELPAWPQMRFFNLFLAVAPDGIISNIAKQMPELRAMTVSVSSPSARHATGEGLSKLTKLEALDFPWGVKAMPNELLELPNLKVLRMGASSTPKTDPKYDSLHQIAGLTEWINRQQQFKGEVTRAWADSGNLESAVAMETYRALDFTKTPNVESIGLWRNSKQHDSYDFEAVGQLSKLRILKIGHVTQDELERLADTPIAGQIESLRLLDGELSDLTSLGKFTNLTELEIKGITGDISSIDLSAFPRIEELYLQELSSLEEVKGLETHPTLVHVRLRHLPMLSLVGKSFAESKLQSMTLTELPLMTDLVPFADAPSIEQVTIINNDELTEPLGLDLNRYFYRYIYHNAHLEDEFPVK